MTQRTHDGEAGFPFSCTIDTPLGPMTAAADEVSLLGLWFIGQKHHPTQTEKWLHRPDHPVFLWLRPYLRCYFAGTAGDHDFPLAPQGSRLEQEVWEAIAALPLRRRSPPRR